MASIKDTLTGLTQPQAQAEVAARNYQQMRQNHDRLRTPGRGDRASDTAEQRTRNEQRRQADLAEATEILDRAEGRIIDQSVAWEEQGLQALERARDEPVVITPQEMERVPASRVQLVKDQARELPADELLRQLRHVTDEGDVIAQKLYLTYARGRRHPENASAEEAHAEREVKATLDRLAEDLANPDTARLTEAGHVLIRRASDLRSATRRAKNDNRRAMGIRTPVA